MVPFAQSLIDFSANLLSHQHPPPLDFRLRKLYHMCICTVPHVLYLTYCTSCTVPHVLYIMYCTSCTVPHVLYIMYCTSCTVPHVLYLMYCTSCTVPHVEKRQQPYSLTIRWMRCHLNFSLLRSSIMCLRGSRYSRFPQTPDSMVLAIHQSKI